MLCDDGPKELISVQQHMRVREVVDDENEDEKSQ